MNTSQVKLEENASRHFSSILLALLPEWVSKNCPLIFLSSAGLGPRPVFSETAGSVGEGLLLPGPAASPRYC